ncbi:replication initiation and membrane attachment family protein [Planococcus lenghuensis]|uniref:Helicase DnaB n=1 Tax=Planococcus lenghuensis TaxID=2213202 RepID=A0A1Q2KXB9_9BACL|nr:DnaD domain protein [Planococcus lenghuensis]AQQ52829.1 helicase DnaB [Planococcus lenghuensis]
MSAYYKELQPTDSYIVCLPYPFTDYDRKLVTLLYQPMIGLEAVSFYLTLWAEGEMMKEEAVHYRLMNSLNISAATIFTVRTQLEAIGLLKTYAKDGEHRSFIYELTPPLDPRSFFADPLLSMFLFSKVGEAAYKRIREHFTPHPVSKEGFTEVSRTFTDVFRPVHAKEGYPNRDADSQTRERSGYQATPEFDFGLLRQGLSEQLVPARVLTPPIREIIAKLAFLYSFSPLDMQKIVLMAIGDDLQLHADVLKKAAADVYKMSVSAKPPELVPAKAKAKSSRKAAPKTKQEEMIDYLESASPADVLRDIAGGKEPMVSDVQLANQLVLSHGMEPAVVNVLLQYVLLRTDMKLTKAYVEKIASHWTRKNVTTAKEAMELARTEHDQYMKWKKEGSPSPAQNRRKTGREEKLPDWFYSKEEDRKKPESQAAASPSLEEEKRKLLAELATRKGKGE